MRIGILGGTFDPPHVGHLLVASDAVEALGLDRLVFIPNARQPLKADVVQASPADRLAMTHLAAGNDPRFEVDPIEVERGGLSYTVETLTALAERTPGAERYFLLGTDAANSFAQWREPQRIAKLARLALMPRAEGGDDLRDGASVIAAIVAVTGTHVPPPTMIVTRRVDVSSTEVRERVRTGRAISGFVPEAVARFIEERGLYRTRHA
ncbi:MAG: nicotinate (nicotinamide) nucleotide adenylyltransferase [Gemmatimonadaceae bacterium]|nr:nicotinate (nicotinamide) nucleotide adenylyltransferase [Gemmatimonadaceae bacterium]